MSRVPAVTITKAQLLLKDNNHATKVYIIGGLLSIRFCLSSDKRVWFTIAGKLSIERFGHCHFDWRPTAGMEKSPLDNAARRTLVQISPLQPTFGGLPVEMPHGPTCKDESHASKRVFGYDSL